MPRRVFVRRLFSAAAGACMIPVCGLRASASNPLYTVRAGDTLSEIALAHGITVRELKRANGLKGDLIRIGQKLKIPVSDARAAMVPVVAATRQIQIDARRWKYIVAHHSAIEQGNAAIYDAGHRRRGMKNGLAYHFVIGNGVDSGDGEIEIGPRWHRQLGGGHVRDSSVNETGIGICLVGNLENHPPTLRQRNSFVELVDYLRRGLVAEDSVFTVHKWVDGSRTLCPGKHFPYAAMSRRYGRR